MGNENFEGGLNTKKYISLTKVSKATAVRDITALVEFGCIKKIDGTAGRNIRYESHLQIAINNPQFKLNQIQKKPFEIV